MYKAYIKFGWDKTKYRTFATIKQCDHWFDKWYKQYLPSQIVATWINSTN